MNRKIIISLFEALVIILFYELAINYLRPNIVKSFSSKLIYFLILFICVKSIMSIFEKISD